MGGWGIAAWLSAPVPVPRLSGVFPADGGLVEIELEAGWIDEELLGLAAFVDGRFAVSERLAAHAKGVGGNWPRLALRTLPWRVGAWLGSDAEWGVVVLASGWGRLAGLWLPRSASSTVNVGGRLIHVRTIGFAFIAASNAALADRVAERIEHAPREAIEPGTRVHCSGVWPVSNRDLLGYEVDRDGLSSTRLEVVDIARLEDDEWRLTYRVSGGPYPHGPPLAWLEQEAIAISVSGATEQGPAGELRIAGAKRCLRELTADLRYWLERSAGSSHRVR